jgi:hypothetical protein
MPGGVSVRDVDVSETTILESVKGRLGDPEKTPLLPFKSPPGAFTPSRIGDYE